MESPLCFLRTLFFASLLLFVFSSPSTIASTRLVKTVCKQTNYNSECLKVLESDSRTALASNYKELAPIALDLAIKSTKRSEAFIKNVLIKTKPGHKHAIKQCANAYRSVVLNFQSAREEIHQGDPQTASYDIVMAIGDNINLCKTAMKAGGSIPEIASRNHLVHLYSNIGDVITDKLIIN